MSLEAVISIIHFYFLEILYLLINLVISELEILSVSLLKHTLTRKMDEKMFVPFRF